MKFSRSKKRDAPSRRQAGHGTRSELDTTAQWRRNRTLSGVRPKIDPNTSTRSQVHRLTQQRKRVGSIFLLVIGGVAILALLITQMTARVIVAGSSTAVTHPIDGSTYEKVINDYLGIHPAGRLRFILNEQELSDYAAAVAPEVSHIKQTSSENVVDTHFTITFRKPVAGWQINSHQYYVDDQGVVFQNNYYDTPSVQIVDESGISPEQGSTVASARLLSFVGRVVALSREGGYEVIQASLPSGTTRELEIKLKDNPTLVRLSIDRGAGEQTEDMIRSLHYLAGKGQAASYIDVRVAGRTVYK